MTDTVIAIDNGHVSDWLLEVFEAPTAAPPTERDKFTAAERLCIATYNQALAGVEDCFDQLGGSTFDEHDRLAGYGATPLMGGGGGHIRYLRGLLDNWYEALEVLDGDLHLSSDAPDERVSIAAEHLLAWEADRLVRTFNRTNRLALTYLLNSADAPLCGDGGVVHNGHLVLSGATVGAPLTGNAAG